MSAAATTRRAALVEDAAAGLRHFRIRAGMTLRDPFALVLLAFAGIATVPGWTFGLGLDPLTAWHLPWPGGAVVFSGPPPRAVRLAFGSVSSVLAVSQLLWAALVASVVSGTIALRRSAAGSGPAMPALPIGVRTRLLAEALVAMGFVVAARGVVLSLGGRRLGEVLFGYHARLAAYPEVLRYWPDAPTYAATFAVNTLLGAFLAFPLVLAWMGAVRLDARGLWKPALVAVLDLLAARVGAMAHLASAVLVSAALSVFVLVRLDAERAGSPAPARAIRFRVSPGPLVQLRRDLLFGPLRSLWPFVLPVVVLPFLPDLVHWLQSPGPTRGLHHASLGTLGMMQWLALLALCFFPFGVKLVRSASTGAGLFAGTFERAWSALPVPRRMVVRAVYAHALLVAAFAWLMLTAHAALGHAGFGWPLFELPAVFLVAAIAVCEAVGDRIRGLVAVASLAGFQFILPLAYALAAELFGRGGPDFGGNAVKLTLAAYVLGLVGGLPPLVHLRRSPPVPA